MDRKTKILFLCTGNSCRSQMAEGWARHLKADVIEAFSAGIEKHGLDPMAVKVMAEAGVDISRHNSKVVADLPTRAFDYVVTVCGHAHETCPYVPGKVKVVHVGFDDPPRLAADAKTEQEALAYYRRVRDEIRAFVETLPGALEQKRGLPKNRPRGIRDDRQTGRSLLPVAIRRRAGEDGRLQKRGTPPVYPTAPT